jgi:AhpD family alkylhydroperoxidase
MTERINAFQVAPQGYASLAAVEAYVEASGLDPKLIALVYTRVSQINGCAYCLHMHTKKARDLGESEARLHLLNAWHESGLYSDRERAALAWAEALTNIRESRAADDVYDRTRAHFSQKELADLSIAIAMVNSWNRLALAARSAHPADRPKLAAKTLSQGVSA